MSFILDALKKSEAERHSQAGPALMNMRIAPPRRRMPLWIIALTVILLANLAVLAIVLLRAPARQAPESAAPGQAAGNLPAQPAPMPPQQAMPANALPPPVLLPEPAPSPPDRPPATPRPQPAAPAVQAAPATPPARPAASHNDDALLPSATDLRLSGVAVPELRLALHVYDASAANRYVLLNSQRMREGESTAEGVLLERIAPAGLVLSWRGQRFRLEPGE